jgi:hypothetical protein
MKQHIDDNQLKELKFEQVNKLGKLSGLISYPMTKQEWKRNKKKEHLTMYISLLQWCNIGQMIEILINNAEHKEDEAYPALFFENPNETDFDDRLLHIGLYWEGRRKGIELCDALFEAVKQVL